MEASYASKGVAGAGLGFGIAIFFRAVALIALCGCSTKTRNIALDGLYVNESGTLAIGSIDVMSAPTGEETAAIRYEENTAWLSPSVKTHEIKIMLTGTNAVSGATGIVERICNAFSTVASTNCVGRVK